MPTQTGKARMAVIFMNGNFRMMIGSVPLHVSSPRSACCVCSVEQVQLVLVELDPDLVVGARASRRRAR